MVEDEAELLLEFVDKCILIFRERLNVLDILTVLELALEAEHHLLLFSICFFRECKVSPILPALEMVLKIIQDGIIRHARGVVCVEVRGLRHLQEQLVQGLVLALLSFSQTIVLVKYLRVQQQTVEREDGRLFLQLCAALARSLLIRCFDLNFIFEAVLFLLCRSGTRLSHVSALLFLMAAFV